MNKIVFPLLFTLSALTPAAFASDWQQGAEPTIYDIELGNVHTCDDAVAQKIVVCMNFTESNQ